MSSPDLRLPQALDPMVMDASSSARKKSLKKAVGLLLATGIVLVSGVFLWWHVTRGMPSANDDSATRIVGHIVHWLRRPFGAGEPIGSDFGLSSVTIVVSIVTFIAGSVLGAMKSREIRFRHHRDDPDCPVCQRDSGRHGFSFHNAVIFEMYQYLIAFTVWMSTLCAWFMLGTHQEIGAVAYVLLAAVSMVLLWSSLLLEPDRGVSVAELSARGDSWVRRRNALSKVGSKETSVDKEYRRQRNTFWLLVVGIASFVIVLNGWGMWIEYGRGLVAASPVVWGFVIYVFILEFGFVCMSISVLALETKVERFMTWVMWSMFSVINALLLYAILLALNDGPDSYSKSSIFVIQLFSVIILCPLLLLAGLTGKGPWKAARESLYWNLRPHRDVKGRDRIAGLQVDGKWEKARRYRASVVVSEDGSDSDEDSALSICCTYFDENDNCWYCVTPGSNNRNSEEWRRVRLADSDKESHIEECKGFDAREWRGSHIGPPVHEGTAFDIALCDRSLEWEDGCWNLPQQGGDPSRVKRVFALSGARAQFQLRVQSVRSKCDLAE